MLTETPTLLIFVDKVKIHYFCIHENIPIQAKKVRNQHSYHQLAACVQFSSHVQ